MATETVFFNPNGGPVSAEIRCGHAQDGSYVLTLWNKNQVGERFEGNFLDPHDDTHEFATSRKSLTGQLVQCHADIGITPPITQYAMIVTLWQDGLSIGALTASGEERDRLLVPVNLFARLERRT